MRNIEIVLSLLLMIIAFIALGLIYYYSDDIAMLNPKGLIALLERDLMEIATVLMLIVVIPVFILTAAIAWEYRANNTKAKYTPDWDFNFTAEAIWWGFPFAIVIILSFVGWKSSHELDPHKPIQSITKPLKIQVVALQWKWLFLYPEHNIATVNFIQIPKDTPINFEITADAPMNSFWIPELGGQIYAMPGTKTALNLIATDVGNFPGSSANLSGEGYAGMVFHVKSGTKEEFEKWVESAKQSASSLGQEEYLKMAKPSSYVPETTYKLEKGDLFDWIAMKPMMPKSKEEDSKKSDQEQPKEKDK